MDSGCATRDVSCVGDTECVCLKNGTVSCRENECVSYRVRVTSDDTVGCVASSAYVQCEAGEVASGWACASVVYVSSQHRWDGVDRGV